MRMRQSHCARSKIILFLEHLRKHDFLTNKIIMWHLMYVTGCQTLFNCMCWSQNCGFVTTFVDEVIIVMTHLAWQSFSENQWYRLSRVEPLRVAVQFGVVCMNLSCFDSTLLFIGSSYWTYLCCWASWQTMIMMWNRGGWWRWDF